MANYKLRIHLDSLIPDTFESSCHELSKQLSGTYMFAYEVEATRPHVQAGFTHLSTRPDTVKSFIKKHFRFVDKKLNNADWSCVKDNEPSTWHRYFQYLAKEGHTIVSSFVPDEIQELRLQYEREAKVFEQTKKKEYNKTAKKVQEDRTQKYHRILDKVKERLTEDNVPYFVDDKLIYSGRYEPGNWVVEQGLYVVSTVVIEDYKDSFFTVTMLEPMINRIMSVLYPNYFTDILRRKLRDRILPNN